MKKRIITRIFSILLCLVMLSSLFPTAVLAAWEDGMECWFCNHYHWDEYCCGTCGACSEECTNGGCYLSTHCSECGACDKLADDCPICLSCEDCYVNNGWHCLSCHECHYTSEDELCGYCWFCADCMGGLCDSCGFCEVCWEVENMHCKECGNCYASYAECDFGYDHCEECCVICEQCEECLFEDGIELCDDCGLCVFCCQDNANAEGCECGEYCIENPEWYEHLCPDCGSAFCTVDICDICGLCLDCCEGNSDCSETPPVCVEDDDYDSHFCEDCGECFHNSDICADCEFAGLLLCETCCKIRLEAEGCDCDDRCISDSDIEEHIKNDHKSAGPHSATPQNSFDMDENYHWRPCRFCDETSHITNKTKHTFDNYGICTVCRFDSQQVILILKQPSSIVAKVSDTQVCGEDDPYYPDNNVRTISVAAKGTTALKYQWYVTYDGGEKWLEAKDDPITNFTGAKTNSITFSIPSDGCAYPPAYKCVITDENGNSVTSNVAYVKVVHLYREYDAHIGELMGIINQPNNKDNIGMYGSDGHFVTCVGEECDDYILVPHSFGKNTRLIFDSKTGVGWHERTCIHCGFKSYLENHTHYFYDPETYECEVDFTYKNENQHKLICRFTGCNRTHLESHDYLGWQNHGTPYSNTDGIGIAYKECQICGYSSTKKLQTYDEKNDKMVDTQWTKDNDLVYVENGFASSDIVGKESKIVIGFAPSEYARQEIFDIEYPKVTKWAVTYYCDRGSEGSKIEMDVTKDVQFEKVENELKWIVTVPSFTGRAGGGILTFTPVLEECKHTGGTRLKNASEPICTQDGYTGDTVCADCDGVIFYGEVIESAGKHEGKLTLIPGTSKEGSCEERGYEGTYRCDHCNKTVRGKVTSRVHNGKTIVKNEVKPTCTKFGYSGDIYCECGVLLQEGETLAPRHSNLKLINATNVSCQKKGYTGDWYCSDCKQIVKYGYNVAKGDHAWSLWGKVDDVYHRHTCVVAGCGAEEKEKHTDADRNLTCDDCGYSWGSDSPTIRSLTFNIDIPVIGQKPDYTKFDGKSYYSDGVSANRKNGVEWFDVTANKRFVPGGVNQEFQEGHVYKVTIHFRSKEGYDFIEEEAMTGTINGREAVVEYVTYGDFAGISYTFEALKHQHTMTRVDKVSPTCTTAGKQTYYYCSSCNKYFEDAAGSKQITNLSSWGNVAALGHVESDLRSNSTHHFKVCTRCYQEIAGSKVEHSGGTATCVQKAKCSICGTFYGNYADHSMATDVWGYIDTKGHAHLCLIEGCYHRGEILSHRSSGPATETEDETCLDCGYVITKAQNHAHKPLPGYQFDDDSHWQVCGCGEILNKQDHVDANEDEKCDICNGKTNSGNTEPGTTPGTDNPGTDNPGQSGGGDENIKNLTWLWILLVILVGAGSGFAIFWFVFKKKENNKNAK